MSDIVVVGYRMPQSNKVDTYSKKASPVTSGQARPGDSMGTPAEAGSALAVNGEITNEQNRAAIEQAAKRLAEALLQLRDALEGKDPNTTVTFKVDGSVYTGRVGDILADLNNTRFTVTDRTNFKDNNGDGAASRGNPNKEFINFHDINDPDSYGSPNYVGNAGLIGIMLHELAHISEMGTRFYNDSRSYAKRDPQTKSTSNFFNTVYAKNLESFANDYMAAIAGAIGVDLQGMRPGGYGPAKSPTSIYNSHVPPVNQE